MLSTSDSARTELSQYGAALQYSQYRQTHQLDRNRRQATVRDRSVVQALAVSFVKPNKVHLVAASREPPVIKPATIAGGPKA